VRPETLFAKLFRLGAANLPIRSAPFDALRLTVSTRRGSFIPIHVRRRPGRRPEALRRRTPRGAALPGSHEVRTCAASPNSLCLAGETPYECRLRRIRAANCAQHAVVMSWDVYMRPRAKRRSPRVCRLCHAWMMRRLGFSNSGSQALQRGVSECYLFRQFPVVVRILEGRLTRVGGPTMSHFFQSPQTVR